MLCFVDFGVLEFQPDMQKSRTGLPIETRWPITAEPAGSTRVIRTSKKSPHLAIFAALVLALLECHPKADDLAKEARQTTGRLLLDANPAMPSNVMGSDRKSLSEITSGQATSVDHGLNPEINHSNAQANATSWSPSQRSDSGQAARTKFPNVRFRSSMHPRYVDVKTRLIALWHQSLRHEKSRGGTLFPNSNTAARKKVGYTAETYH